MLISPSRCPRISSQMERRVCDGANVAPGDFRSMRSVTGARIRVQLPEPGASCRWKLGRSRKWEMDACRIPDYLWSNEEAPGFVRITRGRAIVKKSASGDGMALFRRCTHVGGLRERLGGGAHRGLPGGAGELAPGGLPYNISDRLRTMRSARKKEHHHGGTR